VVNSRYGYALRGIHDNEKRMPGPSAYNTWLYKYTSWIIAAAFGAVAGVLFAYYGGTIVPNNLAMVTSDIAFLLVIMGSTTRFFGPLVASVIYVGVEYLSSLYLKERWPLIFGAMFVFTIMVIPDGLGVWILSYGRRCSVAPLLETRAISVHSGTGRGQGSEPRVEPGERLASCGPNGAGRPPSSTCSPANSSRRQARCFSRGKTSPRAKGLRAGPTWEWPVPSR